MSKKVVIVGGVAGGASAAARARRLSEDAEIILVERGPDVSFANCGLPYHVGGEIAERDKLLVQTPCSLRARFNLDVRVNTEAVRIDPRTRTVELRNVRTGDTRTESYTDLVLSPGAAPLTPPIPGIDRPGNFVVRNVPDIDRIMAWLGAKSAKRAVVVGGGYIGLEMAEQLAHRGLKVAVAEALPQVMAPLDADMAAWIHAELARHGVDTAPWRRGRRRLRLPRQTSPPLRPSWCSSSGRRLQADIVILGLGVKPEVSLARDAGLEIGARGGIRVDEHMRTSRARHLRGGRRGGGA